MSGHTPGPWSLERDGSVVMANQVVIVSPAPDGASRETEKANARLIAAAPDGLALAEHIVAMATDPYLCGHPEWDFIVAEAAALLAKAEGK